MPERVFITGLGVVSPIGSSLREYWEGLLFRTNRPVESQYFHSQHLKNRWCYHVPDRKDRVVDSTGKVTDFAIRATAMSLLDAGFKENLNSIIGVSIGTGLGEIGVIEQARESHSQVNGLDAFAYQVASNVAQHYRFIGPNLSVSTACTSGGYSLSLAVQLLQNGLADAMVVGGVEQVARASMASFNRLNALDTEICRPFDAKRQGTIIGEGAAMMVLESESHARRRKCSSFYAEIKGYGWSCDGYHATVPDPSGYHPKIAIQKALIEANMSIDDIDCIIPHGTGTPLNDLMEAQVISEVFGERVNQLLLCSIKSQIGHTAGASAAFSCITGAMILQFQSIPPTTNLTTLDSKCQLKFHCKEPMPANIKNVLLNAYAFGGNNISIILGRSYDR
jgi:3-oxoacyl-[acyl-carrier-protein] synthase II